MPSLAIFNTTNFNPASKPLHSYVFNANGWIAPVGQNYSNLGYTAAYMNDFMASGFGEMGKASWVYNVPAQFPNATYYYTIASAVTVVSGNTQTTTYYDQSGIQGGNGSEVIYDWAGDDIYVTGGGADLIVDSGGNNAIDAGSGNDVVFTGHGDDVIKLGTGDDKVATNGGVDNVLAGTGNDLIELGDGDDAAWGENGNDSIWGEAGNDYLIGGNNNDYLDGGADDDYLQGDAGHDTLDGGDGHDLLQGDAGNDVLIGGAGNDTLSGGNNKDTLTGGEGDDVLTGGAAADVFIFGANSGDDVITDFQRTADDIHLVVADTGLADFAAVQSAAYQSGADLVIDLAGGASITIENMTYAQLNANQFVFI